MDRIILDKEPDWSINPDLKEAVLSDIPRDLSLEDQALYIYCKLCKELKYDYNYYYRNFNLSHDVKPDFNKNNLEKIKPGSKVSCWNFARVLSKFINNLDGEINASIISDSKDNKHFSVGLCTNNITAILDAVGSKAYGFNDLMKAKNGIEFEGIEILSDKNNLLNNSIKKIYPMVFGKQQISIQDYSEQLKNLPYQNNIPNDLESRLKAFTEIMRNSDISGDEAIQTFIAFNHSGFFCQKLDKAFVGKRYTPQRYRQEYKRSILLRPHSEEKAKPGDLFYLLDSDPLELTTYNSRDLILDLNIDALVYENSKHKIPGIDKDDITRW